MNVIEILQNCSDLAKRQFSDATPEGRLAAANYEIELLRTKLRQVALMLEAKQKEETK